MQIQKLFIHRQVENEPLTHSIQKRLKLDAEWVDGPDEINRAICSAADVHTHAKKMLFLTSNKGAFIKDCPGTQNYRCCGYKILHVGTFCTMECTYCILQAYFRPPVLQLFVNQKRMFVELEELFQKKTVTRVGTGEFTDSMIWEQVAPLSRKLVVRFAAQSHAVLELKTKTVSIDGLQNVDHGGKTIVSWSLNTERIIAMQERGTASLKARLKAAAKCEKWGYPLAFHFDPMFIYDGCEDEYLNVISDLFRYVDPQSIAWISMGAFRFMPGLKPIVQKRFPDSKIVYGEFVQGLDNKMRYFKPLRLKLFRSLAGRIKNIAPQVTVYFCMESDDVWEEALGFTPDSRGGLARMLDESAVRHCNLTSLVASK